MLATQIWSLSRLKTLFRHFDKHLVRMSCLGLHLPFLSSSYPHLSKYKLSIAGRHLLPCHCLVSRIQYTHVANFQQKATDLGTAQQKRLGFDRKRASTIAPERNSSSLAIDGASQHLSATDLSHGQDPVDCRCSRSNATAVVSVQIRTAIHLLILSFRLLLLRRKTTAASACDCRQTQQSDIVPRSTSDCSSLSVRV